LKEGGAPAETPSGRVGLGCFPDIRRRKERWTVRQFVEYGDVEHDIAHNEFRVDMLRRIGEFLDRHTGPRGEPSFIRRSIRAV
jgi:hypothetical protein